jgi:BMFP domain-containing protein YqiC
MQTENPLLDDLARVATGALGALTGMRAEIESRIRDQLEHVLSRMDLVTREEFDAVRAMAAKSRLEQETLAQRLHAVESRLAALESATVRPARSGGDKKPAAAAPRKAATQPE